MRQNAGKEQIMPKHLIVLIFIVVTATLAVAQSSRFGFQPLVNEVSIYQNNLDSGRNAGQTLQVIAINSIRIFTDFKIEFTADFNRKFTPGYKSDYYMEIGVVKPVYKGVSLNFQRIYGTFILEEVNQIGIRISF
jgi:hypothetical protein